VTYDPWEEDTTYSGWLIWRTTNDKDYYNGV
jgi:hypothetical protein